MAKILSAGIVYETDANGDYVLDADGNPIVKDASGYKAIIQKFNILKEYLPTLGAWILPSFVKLSCVVRQK